MLNEIDLSRADLNLLVLFEAVLAERHVGRAADRLSLTASAVSHGLGRLRKLLNDPLFLRTPKGVVPTARATELADPIAEILARVRSVVSTAEPFDPAKSTRRFMIGAPDGAAGVFLPQLIAVLRAAAPHVDIGVRQLLPPNSAKTIARAWEPALAELEMRAIDVAIIPLDQVPPRFVSRTLYEEDFVVASRPGHAFARDPTLDRFCEMQHVLVSANADPRGFVDEMLARQGRSRRIALTVPDCMMALSMIADTDLIGALPRTYVAMHGPRFGVVTSELPLPSPLPKGRAPICAIATRAALMDAGVAWLLETLGQASRRDVLPIGGMARRRRRSA
jgi:DNA-binding transcriptional LysR family regulator